MPKTESDFEAGSGTYKEDHTLQDRSSGACAENTENSFTTIPEYVRKRCISQTAEILLGLLQSSAIQFGHDGRPRLFKRIPYILKSLALRLATSAGSGSSQVVILHSEIYHDSQYVVSFAITLHTLTLLLQRNQLCAREVMY